jgi:hypothetical protein
VVFAVLAKRHSKVYEGVPPVAVAMNLHETLPPPPATHGVPSTLNEPESAGMLVVVVDVVDVLAVEVVVVDAMLVDVVLVELVVT